MSQNFYWRGIKEDNYQTLNDMPKVELTGSWSAVPSKEADGNTVLDVRLENPTAQVALMTCIKVVKAKAPDQRVLPIFYDDNYVSLLPHETRHIRVEFETKALGDSPPKIVAQGWNVPTFDLSQ